MYCYVSVYLETVNTHNICTCAISSMITTQALSNSLHLFFCSLRLDWNNFQDQWHFSSYVYLWQQLNKLHAVCTHPHQHTHTLTPTHASNTHILTGLFSCIMRDLANTANDCPKWIVLDGDIDPMWIESLNTVMDDNKVRKHGSCYIL